MVGTFRCECGYETPADTSLPVLCPKCGAPAPADSLVLARPANGDPGSPQPERPGLPGVRASETTPHLPAVHALLTSSMPTPALPADGNAAGYDVAFAPTQAFGEAAANRSGPTTIPAVPGFDVFGELGRGGMGVVYKARQVTLNRLVALKMILAGSQAGLAERARFRREAEAVAALHHPNIVQIFEVGECDSQPYLALEFVDGGSLAQYLAGGKVWAATDAAWLIAQLGRTMQYAHDQGVVHRDLKPGNVLLQKVEAGRGKGDTPPSERTRLARMRAQAANRDADAPPTAFEPKVTDFGLAKRLDDSAASAGTKTGAVMGTPSYIAPEQAAGRPDAVGPLADVYALGAILYELLTGRPPFKGDTPLDTVLQVLNDEPVPPTRLRPRLARDLETICLKCLEKDPARRYASAADLADDLDRFLVGEPILARPLSAVGRAVKWARRHPAAAGIGFTLVASVVSVLGILGTSYAKIADANDRFRKEAEKAKAGWAEANEQERKAKAAAEKEREERERADKSARELAEKNAQLEEKDNRNRRGLYALQLAQVAALAERNPRRGQDLLKLCRADDRDIAWRYLDRLCQREVRAIPHPKPLRAVAADPFGVLFATACEDGLVRVFEPISGREYAVLRGHEGPVNAVAFAPDGLTLATGGDDGTVRVWRLPAEMRFLRTAVVRDLAGIAYDLGLKQTPVGPTFTLPLRRSAFGPPPAVRSVAFGAGGWQVAAGGDDGVPRVWDFRPKAAAALAGWAATTARPPTDDLHLPLTPPGPPRAFTREHHRKSINAVALSPDGRYLATAGQDGYGNLYVLDGDKPDGEQKAVPLANGKTGIPGLAFSPDGGTIALIRNGERHDDDPAVQLSVWLPDRRFPGPGRTITGHTFPIQSVAFSSDGTQIVTAGADRTVRVWDARTGADLLVLDNPDPLVGAAVFPVLPNVPGRRFVVSIDLGGVARVWRTDVRPAEAVEMGSPRPLVAAAASADGRFVVAADRDGNVLARVLDRPDATPSATGLTVAAEGFLTKPKWFATEKISPDLGEVRAVAIGGAYAVAAGDRGFAVWDLSGLARGVGKDKKFPPPPPRFVVTGTKFFAAAVAPDGRTAAVVAATGETRAVRLWNLDTGEPEPGDAVVTDPELREVAFPPPGSPGRPTPPYLVAAIGTGVRVVHLGKPGVVADVPGARSAKIDAVGFAPNGTAVVTGDEDGGVRVWDLLDDAGGFRLRLRAAWADPEDAANRGPAAVGHTDGVTGVAFTADGKTVVSAGRDRAVILWDPVTAQERATLTGHTDRVLGLTVGRGDRFLMTVGQSGTIKRWRADDIPRPGPRPNPFLGGWKNPFVND